MACHRDVGRGSGDSQNIHRAGEAMIKARDGLAHRAQLCNRGKYTCWKYTEAVESHVASHCARRMSRVATLPYQYDFNSKMNE